MRHAFLTRERASARQPIPLPLALSIALAMPTPAMATEARFDRRALEQLGLDPGLADVFAKSARFAAGPQFVEVTVNGAARGKATILIDDAGDARLTPLAMEALRLRTTAALADDAAQAGAAVTDLWPGAIVKLFPGKQRIELVLPADALVVAATPLQYSRGGTAAVLNYTVSANSFVVGGRERNTFSAYTEMGFNTHDWVVRGTHSLSQREGRTRSRFGTAYAQRSLDDQALLLQVGQLGMANPLFAGASLLGMQLLPETALATGSTVVGPVVEGVALSEAQVEIRQGDRLLYTALLPAGPFALSGFPVRDSGSDLHVTLYEASGERSFTVPAIANDRRGPSVPGPTFTVGRRYEPGRSGQSSNDSSPVLAGSASAALAGGRGIVTTAGLVSDQYFGLGFSVGADAGPLHVSGGSVLSHQHSTGQLGFRNELRLGASGEHVSWRLGVDHRSADYRDFLETSWRDEASLQCGARWQAVAGVGVRARWLGSFNASYLPSHSCEKRHDERFNVNWSRRVGRGTVNASLQSVLSNNRAQVRSDRRFYLTYTVPLQAGGISASAERSAWTRSVRVDADHRFSPSVSARAAVAQSDNGGAPSLSAGVNLRPRNVSVSASATRSDNARSVNAQLSGGIAAGRDGVAFSASRVQDTFAFVRVDGGPGVRLTSAGSESWTDRRGLALVPGVSAYRDTRVQVDGRSLPRSADVSQGVQTLQLKRGAVGAATFRLRHARRVMAHVTFSDGAQLPSGASVYGDGAFVGVVLPQGRVYLPDYNADQIVEVRLSQGERCVLQMEELETTREDSFLENGRAVCVVTAATSTDDGAQR